MILITSSREESLALVKLVYYDANTMDFWVVPSGFARELITICSLSFYHT
jgi:hypothetical protein